MMEILIKQSSILEGSCDLLVVGVFAKRLVAGSSAAVEVNKALDGWLEQEIERSCFEGKKGEWLSFPTFGKIKAKRIGVIGLGERAAFSTDVLRVLGAKVARCGRDARAKTLVTTLIGAEVADISSREIAQALAEGAWLGSYRFHAYKEKEAKEAAKREVKRLTIVEQEKQKLAPAERGVAEARALAEATMLARDLVNTPSMEMTPTKLAEVAKTLVARGSGISAKFFDAQKMEKMGMAAALAVSRGSQHPPVGVHLTYKPSGKAKKKIVVVGKAVTFDSGGLSLKPSDSMMTMKIDMAGAASVLGLFKALSSLALNVEVHGIFLAVENMPSGSAYRPGDVVRAMNGKTIEVLNTDAEGRVTLADALVYASNLKPDALIDLATLTGACVTALGEEIAGLMANDSKLTTKLLQASKETGEVVWELPLFRPYEDHIKSKIADVKNIGQRGSAGTISAALFLEKFVGEGIAWAHVDIAGPAYTEKETRPDLPFGGTGFGVRMMMEYLQNL